MLTWLYRINRKNEYEDAADEDNEEGGEVEEDEKEQQKAPFIVIRSPPLSVSEQEGETALFRDRSVRKIMQTLYEQQLREEEEEEEGGEGGGERDGAADLAVGALPHVDESPVRDVDRAVSSLLYASMHPSLLRHNRAYRSASTFSVT